MERNLALLFMDSAPKEVKQAADDHKKNYNRVAKAQAQIEQSTAELADAKKDFDETQRILNRAIDAWDPNAKPAEKEIKVSK